MPRSELISTPKTEVLLFIRRHGLLGWGHNPPASTFKDDKLPSLLRIKPQIIYPGQARDVIKLLRCSGNIVWAMIFICFYIFISCSKLPCMKDIRLNGHKTDCYRQSIVSQAMIYVCFSWKMKDKTVDFMKQSSQVYARARVCVCVCVCVRARLLYMCLSVSLSVMCLPLLYQFSYFPYTFILPSLIHGCGSEPHRW